MCGVLGWVGGASDREAERFERALDLMAHRGPDDRGLYREPGVLLGSRRLAIIDLTPSGHQPMVDPDTGAVIVFNGEIYNYPELRSQLEAKGRRFRTHTDTEVLLQAVLEWGEEALGKLNGMWAFAIWDPASRSLLMSRDRFGVKPLYILRSRNALLFASEPKALLELSPTHRAVDVATLYGFLAEGALYSTNRSFYRGIEVVPPASWVRFFPDTGVCKQEKYWSYPQKVVPLGDPRAEAEEFTGLLEDSVRVRLRSDVPVGITLSGGLDSTAVLAASMKADSTPRACFTSVYGQGAYDEADWARRAAEPYRIAPIQVLAPYGRWIETLGQISWYMDGPSYPPAVYPLWQLMARARREGVPVILEGQGADEALGGYTHYGSLDLLGHVRAALHRPGPSSLGRIPRVWANLARTFTARQLNLWIARELFPFLVALRRRRRGALSTLRPEVFDDQRPSESGAVDLPDATDLDAVTLRLREDHSSLILPGLLQYGDAISMAHSIESRQPFLDYRLVEWLFERPASVKIVEGETKWPLRQFLKARGQEQIAARRDKMGYPTPVDDWLLKDRGAMISSYLTAPGALIHEYCDPRKIERLIHLHLRGAIGIGNHLYRLLGAEMWLHSSIARQTQPPIPAALSA